MIKVYSKQAAIHAENIARALGGELVRDFKQCKWMIFVFIHPNLTPIVEQCRAYGVKTCAYWVGSDAWMAANEPWYRKKLPYFDKHLCVHERIKEDLKKADITSYVAYFLANKVPTTYFEPSEPKVGIYMPSHHGKYWFALMCDIAKAVPDLDFVFYGSNDLPTMPDNCINAGLQTPEVASYYLRAFSVILRITKHDGFPQNVIEMKMQEKNCITNYPYQGCLVAEDLHEVVALLYNPKTHQRDTSEWPAWYRSNCTPMAFAQSVKIQLGLKEDE